MRILVVGAGGVGGYFGGRLAAAGRDVTFLVRPPRAAALAERGLVVRSPRGDLHLPAPATVTADALDRPFDLVILSCKAYDLDTAVDAFAPAMGPTSLVLPLLNGMRHLDVLDARFGAARVLGGRCLISAGLDPDGAIAHMSPFHTLTFGARDGAPMAAVEAALSNAGFDAEPSAAILQDMWEKWIFIAVGAAATCLMRSAIGDIVAAGGRDLILAMLGECSRITAANGFPPRDAAVQRTREVFTAPGSTLTASMLRDMERGGPIEADHIIGDLLRRAGETTEAPILATAYLHLKAYEARRSREAASAA